MFGCATGEPPLTEISGAKAPVLHDLADISLAVRSIDCDDLNQCSVVARGVYQGRTVGLKVVFGVRVGNGRGMAYESIGRESDALLDAMATLYGQPLPSPHFAARVYGDMILLGGDLRSLRTSPVQAKVFLFAKGAQSSSAELYTNVDARRGVLEILEKDPGYRENVLAALAQ
ncbi:hypothetical protein BLA6863_02445 [Burkholderia lata]|jgi:hypothetical protein|uniref:Uncharacterized protein n=2 Tax=Burkholderiaceae TaxID=119060 RepID=A0A6P2KCJ7_BURL3|nr:hypothetical protein BLA6863_02445 [Burkholderia lata]